MVQKTYLFNYIMRIRLLDLTHFYILQKKKKEVQLVYQL